MAVFKVEQNGKITWASKFRYETWTGEIKQKKKIGFATRREAVEWERAFLDGCKNDVTMTFESLVEKYMADCAARLEPTSVMHKAYIINKKLLPYFGKLKLNEINVNTVRLWQNTLITHPENYSPTYLRSIHNQLSAIMNFAVKFYGLPKNPAAICGSMGKKHADSMAFWTIDEFKTFIASVDDIRLRTIFFLLFYSGIREGELLALTLNDFDFKLGTMSINKNFAMVKGKGIIKEPKTPKSKRVITLPQPILDMIKDYVKIIYDYEPHERLFPIPKSSLVRNMGKYCTLSGVKRIRVHDLRHSHASMLIELGVPPIAISDRLGHEDIQTTLNVYSHLYPNKQHEIAEMLAAQIPQNRGNF